MKRKIINELINWKDTHSDKPILLTGLRGVGKTYLAYDFAKAFFTRVFYVNFEREPKAASHFIESNKESLKTSIHQYFQITEEDLGIDRILIIDEITASSNGFAMLEAVKELGIFPYIIAISSSPIKTDLNHYHHILLHPFEFDEFLRATANEWYIEAILTHYKFNKKMPDIVHKELMVLFQQYLRIGGMPCAINDYLNLSSEVNVGQQHNFLIGSYHNTIQKGNSESDALKMNQVLNSLTLQLMKENKKFQYKLIRKGTTHAMYKDAIQALSDYHYIIRNNKLTNQMVQEQYYSKEDSEIELPNHFKLYMPDVGMLYTKMLEEKDKSFDNNAIVALIENYVAQALNTKGYTLWFWESDSMAKIDFLIHKDNELLPIEVHRNAHTRSKCISILKQHSDFPYAMKISSKNFDYVNNIKYVPYYAVFCI